MTGDIPSGTVTFLFTDIVGSTRLWEEQPEQMAIALALHDELLTKTIGAAGGYIFKRIGDAYCAAFQRPSDGILAAIRGQAELLTANSSALTLSVRMALHTGIAEERDRDYFGPVVNRVARLLSIGHGGQILLSEASATRAMLEGPFTFIDLGNHRLKDLQQPERVYQLKHPELPSEFPPLSSLGAAATNIPAQLTAFIGRERELEDVRKLLDSGVLTTIVGAGGAGKTRLALEAAAERVDLYPDGVWLAELGQITDGELVAQEVAGALGVREVGQRSIVEMLTAYLRSRNMLLVIDNCEHVLSHCAKLIEALLRASPGLHILATSREPLGIPGEQVFRAPSMSAPDPSRLPPLSELVRFESVRLFQDRALACLPGFEITEENALPVAKICSGLDGIPLAIELAAARVKSLSVRQLADRLDDRFRILTGGSRTALPRQQRLRATIDWSYDLLSPQEQLLLERLSVFSGGWSLEAAEQICADEQENSSESGAFESWEVLDLLSQLVDKSLVVFDTTREESRYRLLETVRAYAREKLSGRGELERLARRRLSYFCSIAESAAPELRTSRQPEVLDKLSSEHDNLRGSLEDAGAVDPVLGARLAVALWQFWAIQGFCSEGYRWLQQATQVDGLAPATRARACLGAAWLGDFLSLREQAEQFAIDGAAAAEQAGDAWAGALLKMLLGWVRRDRGIADTEPLFKAAMEQGRERRDPWLLAEVLSTWGVCRLYNRHVEGTAELFEEGLAAAIRSGDRWLIGELQFNVGLTASMAHDYDSMLTNFSESLEIRRNLGDKNGIAITLHSLGLVALNRNDLKLARERFVEALRIRQDIGSQPGIATSLDGLGMLEIASENWERGLTILAAAQAFRDQIGSRRLTVWQDDIEVARSVAHEKLSAEEASRAHAIGRQLTVEEATMLALS